MMTKSWPFTLALASILLGGCGASSSDDATDSDDSDSTSARVEFHVRYADNLNVMQVAGGDASTVLVQLYDENATGGAGTSLVAYDASSGAVRWTYKYAGVGSMHAFAVQDGNVVVFDGGAGKGRRTLSMSTGAILSDQTGPLESGGVEAWRADGSLVTAGFEVISGNMHAVVRGYDSSGAQKFRWQDPDCFNCDQSFGWSAPAVGPDGTVYVALGESLRAFGTSGLLWEGPDRSGSSNPVDLTIAADGSLIEKTVVDTQVFSPTTPIENGSKTSTPLAQSGTYGPTLAFLGVVPYATNQSAALVFSEASPTYGITQDQLYYETLAGQMIATAARDTSINPVDNLAGPELGLFPKTAWDGVLVQTTAGVALRRVASNAESQAWTRSGFFFPLNVEGDPAVMGVCKRPPVYPVASDRVALCELNSTGTRKWQATIPWTSDDNTIRPRAQQGDVASFPGDGELELVNDAAANRLIVSFPYEREIYVLRTN